LIGALLSFGCSGSDIVTANVAGAAGMAHAAGSGGIDEPAAAGGTAGVAGTPGTSGGAPVDDTAGAGGACAGEYACPAVLYFSHAQITADLPISVADAADAVFTACRNGECYSATGSAMVNASAPSLGWRETMGGGSILLTFGGSGATSFVVLRWNFDPEAPSASDHYSLTVQALFDSDPAVVFDNQVRYMTKVADPTLVSEGYCRHCSEISVAELDLRATN